MRYLLSAGLLFFTIGITWAVYKLTIREIQKRRKLREQEIEQASHSPQALAAFQARAERRQRRYQPILKMLPFLLVGVYTLMLVSSLAGVYFLVRHILGYDGGWQIDQFIISPFLLAYSIFALIIFFRSQAK